MALRLELVGHVFVVFSIGEDIHIAARVLRATDDPCNLLWDIASNDVACSDFPLDNLIRSNPGSDPIAFNFECIDGSIQVRLVCKACCYHFGELYAINTINSSSLEA